VVLVAELGMESQRLAALYLMKAWGVADSNYEEEVKEVVDQTEKIYKDLLEEKDEKLVSQEIKEKLKKVEQEFISFSVMATRKSGRFMPSAAEKMASKIFEELKNILDMEQTLVEGNVSYFIPIADEKSAGEIFRATTGIVSVNGEVTS
jgi:predicted RNA-binding protein with EMAP domain